MTPQSQPQSTTQPPIEISQEARDAAIKECAEYSQETVQLTGYYVQLAINHTLEAKEKELRELKNSCGADAVKQIIQQLADTKKERDQLRQQVQELQQEQAAIRQGIISAEKPTGDGEDILDLLQVFIEHHKQKEQANLTLEMQVSELKSLMQPALSYFRHVQGWSTHGPANLSAEEIGDGIAKALSTPLQTPALDKIKKALTELLERYVGLVNCGDCGNWNPETEKEVVKARAAIAMFPPKKD